MADKKAQTAVLVLIRAQSARIRTALRTRFLPAKFSALDVVDIESHGL